MQQGHWLAWVQHRCLHLFTCAAALLQAREFEGNPLELSYFLLSNLPVDDDVRQQLLEACSGGWAGAVINLFATGWAVMSSQNEL